MVFIALFALLLVATEYFGMLSSSTPRTPRWPLWTWVAILAATYAAELGAIYWAARHQYPMTSWRLSMPLSVVDDRTLKTQHPDLITGLLLVLTAAQSYVLLAVYRSQSRPRGTIWIGFGVLLVLSLAAPALISFDMYGYVHDSILGLAAYNPPNVPFAGAYHVFDLWFGGPSPTLYGPLWLALVKVVMALGPTLLAKLLVWRAFCALLYLALLLGLRTLRMPDRILAVVALNPGFMLQFVANGHNDLVAIVLLVFAAILARDRWWLSLGLIAVAGLVKLPYAVLGLPLMALMNPMWLRILAAIAMVAVTALFSWIGGGTAYFATLLGHVGARPEDILHRVAGVAALVLLVTAFLGMRRLRTASWIMSSMASIMFAWYSVWGMPYALARRRVLSYLLVCFPFATMLVESSFVRQWSLMYVIGVVALVSIFAPERPLELPQRPKARVRTKQAKVAAALRQAQGDA